MRAVAQFSLTALAKGLKMYCTGCHNPRQVNVEPYGQRTNFKFSHMLLQVLRKEQAMSEDSAFLKGQMEALLKVRLNPINSVAYTG